MCLNDMCRRMVCVHGVCVCECAWCVYVSVHGECIYMAYVHGMCA